MEGLRQIMDGFRLNNWCSVRISKLICPEDKSEAFPSLFSFWHKLLDFVHAGTI
jgi:hypothetical protein